MVESMVVTVVAAKNLQKTRKCIRSIDPSMTLKSNLEVTLKSLKSYLKVTKKSLKSNLKVT